MKGDKVFLDTNLLLYAYDAGSPAKHAVAVRILEDLHRHPSAVLPRTYFGQSPIRFAAIRSFDALPSGTASTSSL